MFAARATLHFRPPGETGRSAFTPKFLYHITIGRIERRRAQRARVGPKVDGGAAHASRHHRRRAGRAASWPFAASGRRRDDRPRAPEPRLCRGAHPRRRARTGHGRPPRRGRRSARACAARACRMAASISPMTASRHRIDLAELTGGKRVMVYGQTELTQRSRRRAARKPARRPSMRRPTSRSTTPTATAPILRYRAGGGSARDRLRFHRRLRRFARHRPALDAGAPRSRHSSASIPSAGSAFSPTCRPARMN